MNAPTVWLAPAKINLFLHITGQRSDGMHELQTVFQFLTLSDQLHFTPLSDGRIKQASVIPSVPPEQDLCLRAAHLLRDQGGLTVGVEIALEKNIPIGGGLGGASSDAATTLHALNQLWDLAASEDDLAALGMQLGADVPIFVRGLAAWAEGVGEKITPLTLPQPWYAVVDTGVHVSSAEMFVNSQLTRNCPRLTMCPPQVGTHANVFEPLVRKRYAQVDRVFDWLASFGTPFLTGTGGCVVVACESEQDALAIQAQAIYDVRVLIAKGRNISPLHQQLTR